MKSKHYLVVCLISISGLTSSNAKEFFSEGYTIVQSTPISNMDLVQTIIRQIEGRSIHDGLQEILQGTGWRLSGFAANDPQLINLLRGPWPEAWREIGPDTLFNILTTIGGEGWQLVVDPVNP